MSQDILFFSTGTVKIRPSMRGQAVGSHWLVRLGRALADSSWTEELPIGAFIIKHPDGPILFDAGESVHCNEPGYLPVLAMASHRLASTTIKESESLLLQIRQAGIEPRELQCIVLSHLHGDHADGLAEIVDVAPNVPVFVGAEHWKAFGNNHKYATIKGCNPQHWPKNFKPRLLEMTGTAVGPWRNSCPVTSDGAVLAVDTFGHVPGHLSLIYKPKDRHRTYFFTGDATYGIDVLDAELPDGINDNPAQALETLRRIKEFARMEEVVVLPSHDPQTPEILRTDKVYIPGASKDTTISSKI